MFLYAAINCQSVVVESFVSFHLSIGSFVMFPDCPENVVEAYGAPPNIVPPPVYLK
jgi:hypothetical protein